MDQRIINLFDEYTHKPLTRDVFIKKLVALTGSTAAAMAVLPLLEVNYAHAATIAETADTLFTQRVVYAGDGTDVRAYLARPKEEKQYPVVVVIHENRGLNPHIEDVTRRLALEGFLAIAPDALSLVGGTPTDADKARDLFSQLDPVKNLSNFIKGFAYARKREDATQKAGCIGFCWGGGIANQLAVHMPDLSVAVPFYGRQPEAADVPKIKAFVQLHYAGLDDRINAGIPAYEEALKKAGTHYEIFTYEGAQHAFHNDTAPTRYNEAAAKLAWSRTVKRLHQELD
ncbi:MAG: dienelactone hydrolase family protein [Bacteroidetes bacterium]|nr:dienelactone hydrolase family protein [Bacteroidota bacterium]